MLDLSKREPMQFKNFRFRVVARVTLLTLTAFLFALLTTQEGYLYSLIGLAALFAWQTIGLIHMVERTNREVIKLLDYIQHDDFSNSYQLNVKGKSFEDLNLALNRVIQYFRSLRAEKELQYQYLRTVIQHIGIGILSFERDGKIQIANHVAKRLLQVRQLHHLNELHEANPSLLGILNNLKTGQKTLLRLQRGHENIELAVYAIELTLQGQEYKLVTLQNIHSELEDKELDAWQNLVRVLTHEIMNALTPISSLASTIISEAEHYKANMEEVETETFDDMSAAAETIERRSTSLVHFINEFRHLTENIEPDYEQVVLRDLIQDAVDEVSPELAAKNIRLDLDLPSESVLVTADPALIRQVLINLLHNAAQALELSEKDDKHIHLFAERDSKKRLNLIVRDNGPGIDSEALPRIFVPFYTTKKNGSGLGLSVSRQIMRQHKGNLSAQSELGKGTDFILRF